MGQFGGAAVTKIILTHHGHVEAFGRFASTAGPISL
jgi:hypothetical protein